MKTRAKFIGIVFFLAFLVGFSWSTEKCANAKMVLKFPSVAAKGYYYDLLAVKLDELVSKRTNGEIEIKSLPGGQLGNNMQLIAAVKMGSVDFHVVDMGVLAFTEDGKDFHIIFLPYLFRDGNHFQKFLKSDTLSNMVSNFEKKSGVKILGYGGDRGPRQVTTSKTAVWKPEDMKGLKIRVPRIQTFIEAFSAWGANPTPMPFVELFTGLQQGVIEGQDNGLDMIESSHFYEVQKYMIATEHVRSGTFVLVNPKKWQTEFNDEQRRIIEESLEEASKYISDLVWKNEAEGIRRITNLHNMRVIIPDVPAFEEAVKHVGPNLDGKLWRKGLYEEIRSIK